MRLVVAQNRLLPRNPVNHSMQKHESGSQQYAAVLPRFQRENFSLPHDAISAVIFCRATIIQRTVVSVLQTGRLCSSSDELNACGYVTRSRNVRRVILELVTRSTHRRGYGERREREIPSSSQTFSFFYLFSYHPLYTFTVPPHVCVCTCSSFFPPSLFFSLPLSLPLCPTAQRQVIRKQFELTCTGRGK